MKKANYAGGWQCLKCGTIGMEKDGKDEQGRPLLYVDVVRRHRKECDEEFTYIPTTVEVMERIDRMEETLMKMIKGLRPA